MSVYTERIAELEAEFTAHQMDIQTQIEVGIGQRSELQARIQVLIEQEGILRDELLTAEHQKIGAVLELERLEALTAPPEPTPEPTPEEPPVTP